MIKLLDIFIKKTNMNFNKTLSLIIDLSDILCYNLIFHEKLTKVPLELTANGSHVPDCELKKKRASRARHGPTSFGNSQKLDVSMALRFCNSCLVCRQMDPNKWAPTCLRPKLIRGSKRGRMRSYLVKMTKN